MKGKCKSVKQTRSGPHSGSRAASGDESVPYAAGAATLMEIAIVSRVKRVHLRVKLEVRFHTLDLPVFDDQGESPWPLAPSG